MPRRNEQAAIYGLIGTAKLNGLNPEAYLREVFSKNRRSPHQSHRGVAAVESRRREDGAVAWRLLLHV
jgi:hypothetical protein